jgi:hypothetical protein
VGCARSIIIAPLVLAYQRALASPARRAHHAAAGICTVEVSCVIFVSATPGATEVLNPAYRAPIGAWREAC